MPLAPMIFLDDRRRPLLPSLVLFLFYSAAGTPAGAGSLSASPVTQPQSLSAVSDALLSGLQDPEPGRLTGPDLQERLGSRLAQSTPLRTEKDNQRSESWAEMSNQGPWTAKLLLYGSRFPTKQLPPNPNFHFHSEAVMPSPIFQPVQAAPMEVGDAPFWGRCSLPQFCLC